MKCERANRPVYLACVDSSNDSNLLDSVNATLQFRWLRSSECIENATWCHFHPERKATLCCGFWKAELIAHGYMFAHACHCSVECFSSQFHVQRQYWERAQAAKQRTVDGASSCRCWSSYNRSLSSALYSRYAGVEDACGVAGPVARVACPSNREASWTVVGSAKKYTPSSLDVGHRLQFQVSVRPQPAT